LLRLTGTSALVTELSVTDEVVN